MTPLAQAIYEILRARVPRDDCRISYGQLVELLPRHHGITYANDSRLREALGEIVAACCRHQLPALPAIVVQQDDEGEPTGEPGNGYFEVTHPETGRDAELRTIAWYREWQRVIVTTYPESLDG